MTRVLVDGSKPIDFDPHNLETGMTVGFVYKPLIGRKREYRCTVESIDKRSLRAYVREEYPVSFSFWSVRHHKRFAFKGMEIHSVSPPQEKYPKVSPEDLIGRHFGDGEDGNYTDEHGIVR